MFRNLHSSVEPIKKSIPAACAKTSDILHFIFPLELSETISSFHRHMNLSVCMLNVSGIADPSRLFWYCRPVVCQPFWFRGPLHLSTFWYLGPLVCQSFWFRRPLPLNFSGTADPSSLNLSGTLDLLPKIVIYDE